MSVHEQFAEDLALQALDALQGAERTNLEQHLESCPGCRRELEDLRGDMALLALSASGTHPPQRSRERLMKAIAEEKQKEAVSSPKLVPSGAVSSSSESDAASGWLGGWFGRLGWASAVAAIIVAAAWVNNTQRKNDSLQQEIAALRTKSDQDTAELLRARAEFNALTGAGSQQVTLVALQQKPQPQGKALYVESSGKLLFIANNMPALPADKAYELWLLAADGKVLPAGVFRPDAKGSGIVVDPQLQPGIAAKGFAITVEPKEGSLVATTKPMMVGLVI